MQHILSRGLQKALGKIGALGRDAKKILPEGYAVDSGVAVISNYEATEYRLSEAVSLEIYDYLCHEPRPQIIVLGFYLVKKNYYRPFLLENIGHNYDISIKLPTSNAPLSRAIRSMDDPDWESLPADCRDGFREIYRWLEKD